MFMYSYMDAFKPSPEVGKINVHLGKKRGGPLDRDLSDRDPLCDAYLGYIGILKGLLKEVPAGQAFLSREFCPIFLHIDRKGTVPVLQGYSPEMAAYLVKRVVADCARTCILLAPLVGKVTGINFRPSIAVVLKLRKSSVASIQRRLKHRSIETTGPYVERAEASGVLRKKATDFQNSIISAALKLRIHKAAEATPLAQEEPVSRRIVLASAVIASNWVAWIRDISAAEARLKFSNPDRWIAYWEIRRVEFVELLSMCSQAVRAEAKALALTLVLPPLD